jgi:hypothetical protein
MGQTAFGMRHRGCMSIGAIGALALAARDWARICIVIESIKEIALQLDRPQALNLTSFCTGKREARR